MRFDPSVVSASVSAIPPVLVMIESLFYVSSRARQVTVEFGKVVEETGHRAYVSNKTLGKVFQMTEHKIAGLLRVRFAKQRYKKLPLMQKLRPMEKSDIPH